MVAVECIMILFSISVAICNGDSLGRIGGAVKLRKARERGGGLIIYLMPSNE